MKAPIQLAPDKAPPQLALSLEEAEVISVSADGYRVTVRTRSGKKLDTQVLFPVLSLGRDTDSFQGAGLSVTPEEGSIAAVISTSYGEYYTFGFAYPYTSSQEYQGDRETRRQGDMTLRSKGGAFMDVLASGLARAGASDLAQTLHNPSDDSVRSVCQNHSINAGLGELTWQVDEQTKKGAYRIQSRSSTDEGSPAANLLLGDSASGNLVELRTTSGKDSSFAIERAGNVRVDSNKDTTIMASSGKIRQQANKIYLNAGAGVAKFRQAFSGNFFQLASAPVLPGSPASMFKFPAFKPPALSLPVPDPKKLLKPPQFNIAVPSLPKVEVPSLKDLGAGLPSVELPKLPELP